MKIDELTKRYKKYLNFNQNLSSYTWFGVGGIADILFTPENIDQAISFIKEKPKDLSIFTIGAGSNILIRDSGISSAMSIKTIAESVAMPIGRALGAAPLANHKIPGRTLV